MSAIYDTNSQINAQYVIGGVVVYYNGKESPILAKDSVKITLPTTNTPDEGSAKTGNSSLGFIYQGGNTKVTITAKGLNKDWLLNLCPESLTGGSTATNSSTPFTGTVFRKDTPSYHTGKKMVIQLLFTDANGNTYINNTSNPMTYCLTNCALTSDIEIPLNQTEEVMYDLEFTGVLNPAESTALSGGFVWDDGITSAGVYTA